MMRALINLNADIKWQRLSGSTVAVAAWLENPDLASMRQEIPLDENREHGNSVYMDGTRILVALNVAVFLWMSTHGGFDPENLVRFGANYSPYTKAGEWWRLLTAVFVHGGPVHIFANMFSLWSLGRLMEHLVGTIKLLTVFIVTGIFASLCSVWFHDEVLSVGASGAIFGLFGAFTGLVLGGHIAGPNGQKVSLSALRSPLLINGAISLIPGIDWAAHLGGFIAGLVIGYLILPRALRGASESLPPHDHAHVDNVLRS